MNKEQQELLEVAYKNYMKWAEEHSKTYLFEPYTQELFVYGIKTDDEFANQWGLKIEERELSTVERMEYYGKHYMKEGESKSFDELLKVDYDKLNIPTKLTTITYNDKTIESYGT